MPRDDGAEPGRSRCDEGRRRRQPPIAARPEHRLPRVQRPKKPFDNKRVRQAFNYGIDKAAIIKDVYQGAGQAANNFIPPTIWTYNTAVRIIPMTWKRPRHS